MSTIEIFFAELIAQPTLFYFVMLGSIFLLFILLTSISGYFSWEQTIKPKKNIQKFQVSTQKTFWIFLIILLCLTPIIPTKRILYLLFLATLAGGFLVFKSYQARQSQKKLMAQIPLFLQALSNGLQAGQSLPQAFMFVEADLETPLLSHIQKINRQVSQNIPIKNALQNFATEVPQSDVQFFVDSVVLQINVGGNLVTVFEKIRQALEERFKLQRDIKSFTAQGKMSGLFMAFLWPISLFVFWKLSPEHINVLFETNAGNLLLALSALLEIFGFIFIWNIIKVKI